MKVRSTHKSFLTLESTAMTDIVLNMFIFFFISFSLLYTFRPEKESKIEVKLPEASAAAQGHKADEPLVVVISSGNEIYLGKKRLLPAAVLKELQSVPQARKASGILVRSDKAASVDLLVKVLDAARSAGIQRLGVAIQQKEA